MSCFSGSAACIHLFIFNQIYDTIKLQYGNNVIKITVFNEIWQITILLNYGIIPINNNMVNYHNINLW